MQCSGRSKPVAGSLHALSREAWQGAEAEHHERTRPAIEDHLRRRSRGLTHPVYDFLFDYYDFSPAQLRRWTPGTGVYLEGGDPKYFPPPFWADEYGVFVSPHSFPQRRAGYLLWALRYLHAVRERPARFGCFGLHEWAMVYREGEVRHPLPFRLDRHEIHRLVESGRLACSHFDAFRFFAPSARTLNPVQLERSVQTEYDQKGCLHVTMDLYKFAYRVYPWCPSSLVIDAFFLAKEARECDMRASPYDLSSLGFPPIRIETEIGREEYVAEQQRLSQRAAALRQRLVEVYEVLCRSQVTDQRGAHSGSREGTAL